jgi:hypothetical protein
MGMLGTIPPCLLTLIGLNQSDNCTGQIHVFVQCLKEDLGIVCANSCEVCRGLGTMLLRVHLKQFEVCEIICINVEARTKEILRSAE